MQQISILVDLLTYSFVIVRLLMQPFLLVLVLMKPVYSSGIADAAMLYTGRIGDVMNCMCEKGDGSKLGVVDVQMQ